MWLEVEEFGSLLCRDFSTRYEELSGFLSGLISTALWESQGMSGNWKEMQGGGTGELLLVCLGRAHQEELWLRGLRTTGPASSVIHSGKTHKKDKDEQLYLRQIRSYRGNIFPCMLVSPQQANACGASDYEASHIKFTQFFSSLQAWSVTNLHMYTGERKEEKKRKNSAARPKEKLVERKRRERATQFQVLTSWNGTFKAALCTFLSEFLQNSVPNPVINLFLIHLW